MNRIYLFLAVIAISFAACTTKSSTATKTEAESVKEEVTEAVETQADKAYETVVIDADKPSPRKEMRAKISDAALTVNYGSPSVKGRAVWGGLVNYDKVWRTGANEATTIETSTDLMIAGKKLPAGKYGLFTIPAEDGNWTVIFNSTSEQWGAYDYDKSKDVLRVNATATETETSVEAMEFTIENGSLALKWDKLVLPVSVSL
ncbi:MAG: DUF2911 domain-containing protein [Saprospiraceae bacterium]